MNVKDKLQQVLGLGVIVVAAALGLWHINSNPVRVAPSTTTPLASIALPSPRVPLVEPEVVATPSPIPQADRRGEPCLADAKVQDAALRAVLKSQVQDDPLFGYTDLTMQLAECASRRWREAGR